jgi:asparagine N-glycosylation enzyme membrane subunit Stt3
MEVAGLILLMPGVVFGVILGLINLSWPAAVVLLSIAILLFRQFRKK